MAIQRHCRSYVIYPAGYDSEAPDAVAREFFVFARARDHVLQSGEGSRVVEWIETFEKDGTSNDRTDREWVVKNGLLRKILNKSGNSIFSEDK